MSSIFPFRAFRYHLSNSELKKVVSPPYDIISEPMAKKLRANPSNAIQIELPAGSHENKYKRAKRIWEMWQERRLVRQDDEPVFYVYEQLFDLPDFSDPYRKLPKAKGLLNPAGLPNLKRVSRKGFFCEAQVEKPGTGTVLRHELTLSKPKEDRLRLLRTLKVNTSPIFGLFLDRQKRVSHILDCFSQQEPLIEFEDSDKIVHRLWKCSANAEIKIIMETLKKSVVIIADGHHRYETAWNYLKSGNKEKNASAVLFYLCPMESPGLALLPTHRILKNSHCSIKNLDQLADRLRSLKQIFEFSLRSRLNDAQLVSTSPKSLIASDGKKILEVQLKSFKKLRELLPGKPDAILHLPLVQLHSVLLPEMKKEDFIYTHDALEAVRLAEKFCSVSFLIPSVSIHELYAIVKKGELMPQKSTYFYPKVIAGLVFRSIK